PNPLPLTRACRNDSWEREGLSDFWAEERAPRSYQQERQRDDRSIPGTRSDSVNRSDDKSRHAPKRPTIPQVIPPIAHSAYVIGVNHLGSALPRNTGSPIRSGRNTVANHS